MRVLIIDDDAVNRLLLRHSLETAGHEVVEAADGQAGLRLIGEGAAQCVVTDWEMPNLSGPSLCQTVRRSDFGSYVYVILMTAHQATQAGGDDEPVRATFGTAEALACGADDFIVKPLDAAVLLARVRVAERILSLETRDLMIFALAKLAESRDPETGAHLERVQEYARVLARDLVDHPTAGYAVDEAYVSAIFRTSPLHDVGKVAIPDAVLLKPGKLTSDEFEVMKSHTMSGGRTLRAAADRCPWSQALQMAVSIAETHHEKWDGSGYPLGLMGQAIPLCGRITAVADVYDALTSRRIYKPAFDHERTRTMIVTDAGRHFDPRLVEAFLRNEDQFIDIARRFADPGEQEVPPATPIRLPGPVKIAA